MALQEEIQAILTDSSMTIDDKREKLLKFVTPQEVQLLLSEPINVVRLKEPLHPKTDKMRILRLSVFNDIFDSIIKGEQDVETRSYNEYFMNRCTYMENGVRYLVPYDAITFYVGRGEKAKKATVAVEDIVCDGDLIYFYLGEILNK